MTPQQQLNEVNAAINTLDIQRAELVARRSLIEQYLRNYEVLPPITNQQFINAVFKACGNITCTGGYWKAITDAGLEHIKNNRNAPFTIHIRDITKFSVALQNEVIRILLLPPDVAVKRFTVSGRQIMDSGNPFRFVGVNLRELSWYGSVTLKYAKWEHVKVQLDAAQAMGAKVVRFFVPHQDFSPAIAIARTLVILDDLKKRGMVGLAVVADNKWSGYDVPGNQRHKGTNGVRPEVMYLKPFYEKGYKDEFIPFLKKFLSTVGQHEALFAVGINEPQFHPYHDGYQVTTADANIFLNFYKDFADTVHQNSPVLVTTGAVAMWDQFVQQAYANGKFAEKVSKVVDFMTIHSYQSSQKYGTTHFHFLNEMKLDVPMVIEEFGCEDAQWGINAINSFYEAGVSGVMHWGFQATPDDIGAGDGQGLCRTSQNGLPGHNWDPLFGCYRRWADQLVNVKGVVNA